MKKIVIVFLILINCIACSSGQTKSSLDNTQEILGCWRLVDITYDIKSNYSQIDSLFLEKKQNLINKRKENSFITKFSDNTMNEYDENGTPDNNPSYYTTQGDSIFIEGIVRKDKSAGKFTIIKDSLSFYENSLKELSSFLLDLKYDYKVNVPRNLKVERIIRHVVCVRVPDCDQYKKEDE